MQACKAQDAEVSQLHKANADTSAKLQKALESLTTAQASEGAWERGQGQGELEQSSRPSGWDAAGAAEGLGKPCM